MTTTAMLLAAGRGERMRPLSDITPKPLLKVKGKSLIEYHIEGLVDAGFKRIVINHAWLGQQIEDTLGDGQRFGIQLLYSPEAQALETAGGIVKALPLLCPEGQDEQDSQFAVVSADIFTDFDFRRLPTLLPLDLAHLVMVNNPLHHPQGDFAFHQGRLGVPQGETLTFSGIAVYRPAFFAQLIAQQSSVMPLAPLLKQAIAKGCVSGQGHLGSWSDAGTPDRLAELNISGVTESS
jgi:MurNAc alpha-1-phosphate uridylyltransferase